MLSATKSNALSAKASMSRPSLDPKRLWTARVVVPASAATARTENAPGPPSATSGTSFPRSAGHSPTRSRSPTEPSTSCCASSGCSSSPTASGRCGRCAASSRRQAGRWSPPGAGTRDLRHPRGRPGSALHPPTSLRSCGSSSRSTNPTSCGASWPTPASADRTRAAHSKTLRLPSPEEFLWQYVSSTPLAAAVAVLDGHARAAVTQDVVASWQPFTQQGRLILELDFSVASGEK